jgi:cob(I)alamin adenosyltransferase
MADENASADDPGYAAPKVAINRVYTRNGDGGDTALAWGQRVGKDDLRVVAYGSVDELNAFIGMARVSLLEQAEARADLAGLADRLLQVQHELFNLGSILATMPADVQPRQPRVTARDVETLEEEIDRCAAELEPLASFVLAGSCRQSAELHLACTVCRRAERACVALARRDSVDGDALAYLNRLGDALFTWSRWVTAKLGAAECLWEPNRASSGSE